MATGSYRHPDEDVALTPEEEHMALLQAKIKKGAMIRQAEYAKKVWAEKIYPILDANALYMLALSRFAKMIPGYVLDDKNIEIFKSLCLYFCGDNRCTTEYGLDLEKGIMLVGPTGCGKTTMMRAFASNSYNSFTEVSCRTVADEYSLPDTGGAAAIDYYSGWKEAYPENFYGQKQIGYFFDDLGTERTKKHYGNEINVMQDVILNRYDNRHLKAKTHLTTNLSADDIETIYGSRVRSRMREMFNFITFDVDAPDRRS